MASPEKSHADRRENSRIVIIMGVSGSGKSSVGRELTRRLGWAFIEGDEVHSTANVEKMERGEPLTDLDRQPWLAALRKLIVAHLERGIPAVVTCSALKQNYRDQLMAGLENVTLVYLQGSYELVAGRMKARTGHFFPADLLRSQFADLEEPAEDAAIFVNVERDVRDIADYVIDHLLE